MQRTIANESTLSEVSRRLAPWYRIMAEDGLTYTDLQASIDDPDLRRAIIDFWQRRASQPSVWRLNRAQEILGSDFHGLDQVEARLNYRFSDADRDRLLATVPSESDLSGTKDSWLVIADPGLSLLDLLQKSRMLGSQQTAVRDENHNFAMTEQVQWLLLPKTAVSGNCAKTLEELLGLVTDHETARQMRRVVLGMVVHCSQ